MPEYTLKISETELNRYKMMAAFAAASEEGWWAEAGFVPGARAVDIGCGPAAVLVELARRVAPGGSIIGVDQSAESLDVAHQVIAEAGIENAEVRQGDATATGLPEGEADIVNIRHVLAHNTPDIVAAIVAHARDLLRPGGTLYLVDADSDMFRFERPVDPDLQDLMDRYWAMLAGRGCEGNAGSHLGAYAEDAGLEVVARRPRIDVVPLLPGLRPPAWAARQAMLDAGLCDDDDIARWQAAFDRADAASTPNNFFAPMFALIARKP